MCRYDPGGVLRPGRPKCTLPSARKVLSLHRILRPIALVAFISGLAAPAQAQIYAWRDANGNLVLSDHPQQGHPVRTYTVAKAADIRVTRPGVRSHPNLYDELIQQHAAAQAVRADLVRAVIQVESGFNPHAVSVKGAKGLMQLMPATIAQFGVVNPFKPADNIRAGVAYLRQLLDKYGNNEVLALAAYNAGPGAVDRYGTQVPPYRETRDYVRKVRDVTAVTSGSDSVIYKTVEIVNGRPVPRYSNTKPATGDYEILPTRR